MRPEDILKDGYVFVEYLEGDGKWYLSQIPLEVAFCAVVQYPESYHILDNSMVIIE